MAPSGRGTRAGPVSGAGRTGFRFGAGVAVMRGGCWARLAGGAGEGEVVVPDDGCLGGGELALGGDGEFAGDGELVVHDLVPAGRVDGAGVGQAVAGGGGEGGGVGGQRGVAVRVGVAAGLHEDGLVALLGAGLDPGGHPGRCLVAEVLVEGPGQRRLRLGGGRAGGRAGGDLLGGGGGAGGRGGGVGGEAGGGGDGGGHRGGDRGGEQDALHCAGPGGEVLVLHDCPRLLSRSR